MKIYDSVWARFWSQVDVLTTDECWDYQGAINSTGRGNFSIGHKNIKAHRMAWILIKGEIPDGLCVLHHCDNGKCCNFSHLFLGTIQDNVTDMIKKGRQRRQYGEDGARAILTNKQALEIREKYIPHVYTSYRLAKEYHVSRGSINAVVQRYTFKNI